MLESISSMDFFYIFNDLTKVHYVLFLFQMYFFIKLYVKQ